jgi:hypothetical protein
MKHLIFLLLLISLSSCGVLKKRYYKSLVTYDNCLKVVNPVVLDIPCKDTIITLPTYSTLINVPVRDTFIDSTIWYQLIDSIFTYKDSLTEAKLLYDKTTNKFNLYVRQQEKSFKVKVADELALLDQYNRLKRNYQILLNDRNDLIAQQAKRDEKKLTNLIYIAAFILSLLIIAFITFYLKQ